MHIGITGHQKVNNEDDWIWVENQIKNFLKGHPGYSGVTSLAKGADQLFAKILDLKGMRFTVVVPCEDYESTFDENDLKNYWSLLTKADQIIKLDFPEPTEEAFYAAGKTIVDKSDLIIAVWNGLPAKGLGGTADIVKYALSKNEKVFHINTTSKEVGYINS